MFCSVAKKTDTHFSQQIGLGKPGVPRVLWKLFPGTEEAPPPPLTPPPLFEPGYHVAQDGLKFVMYVRMALNSYFSCVQTSECEIAGCPSVPSLCSAGHLSKKSVHGTQVVYGLSYSRSSLPPDLPLQAFSVLK